VRRASGILAAAVAVALAALAAMSVRVLDERQVAFRTLLGDPTPPLLGRFMPSQITGPSLYVHLPLLHEVDIYDQRLKRFESPPRVLLMDPQNIEIGYYAIWRVRDVRQMRENLQPSTILPMIDAKTYNAVRNELATRSLADLLGEQGQAIAESIRAQSDAELRKLGIEVVGLGFRHIDFLQGNLPSVFRRMQQAREQISRALRAEGEGAARQTRAEADRDAELALAEARKRAEELRGEGDARAAEIYAQAYEQDIEFYQFTRSLDAYRRALDTQTTVVLSPDDPFLSYFFGQPGGSGGTPLPAAVPASAGAPPEAAGGTRTPLVERTRGAESPPEDGAPGRTRADARTVAPPAVTPTAGDTPPAP
jgi:membrane protease subunit HflC